MRPGARVVLLLSYTSVAVLAQPPAIDASLVGLWMGERAEGQASRGRVTIDARGSEYRAHGAGFDLSVTRTGDEMRFAVPDNRGEFRGRMSADAKTITGHWIQPVGIVSFQPRATTIELVASRSGLWTGEIVPLDERLHLYVDIRRKSGSLVAAIRIPETNWYGNETLRVVASDKDFTLLSAAPPPRDKIRGVYDAANDQLLLSIVGPSPEVFRRVDRSQAAGFYPRTPQPAPYSYRQPDQARDGWRTAHASDAGVNLNPIRALIRSIIEADPADPATVPVHSLLVARHGKLILEEYFYGFDRERPHDSRSAGKTYAPLLAGIARDHGARVDPRSLVSDLLPQYAPFANADDRKARLTLEHMMTMTSGLACDDSDLSTPGAEDRMQAQRGQTDWYKYTVDLPMSREPGGPSAVYCSADLNLVGGIAGTAAGVWNVELFARQVAKPLQFGRYHLNLMPTGDAYTGGGVYLLPRDALKLGQLYLNGGAWNGVRVVSKEWADRSTVAHATFEKPVNDIDVNHEYGYGWHVHHFAVGGRTYRVYSAEGNGGQWVIVFPDLDMVVGINSGKYGSPRWYRWGLETIPKYLIPAAIASP